MITEPYTSLRTRCNVVAEIKEYEIEIDRRLSSPEHWHEELTTLRIAQEQDTVKVFLNTEGGYDTTMKAFLSAISDCKAHTIGVIVGDCSSAGGPIFLACDEQVVKPLGNLMVHTGSSGYSGQANNIEQYAKHTALDNRDIIERCYVDFITKEEMVDVIKGDDLWMREDEIRERLANRETVRYQREVDAAKEEYTPEVYALQILEDISEDCETFGYSVDEIIDLVKGMLSVVEVGEEEQIPVCLNALEEVHPSGYIIGGSHIDIDHCDRELLKFAANTLGIKFAHNLHTEKLRKRILDFLEK
jgi:ATP-dependent protease ClpP protease subunit